ncbi:MAG: inositol 2-dehydrogenase [Clostridiales Family XIII bacterium]|jgi:myo-inositol 2-dehydrogenase/D-chiro-inositol 1-dehydrogenase|nr:inositol 2-dehydrogenase [Clostridiales Family XIII bacterium]
MSNQLRIGLLGLGRIGKLHAANIAAFADKAVVAAAADPLADGDIARFADGLGISDLSKDPYDVINNPDVDALFICSSTATHAEFIIAGAKAGKHIFCEKPIHTDPAKIREALDTVKECGVKLQVGFVRRFDHNHKKVRDVVASGRLGAPHTVKVTSRDPDIAPLSYLETSGGIFMDMTIHDFDMVRYLVGSEATEVTAYGSVLINPEIKAFGDADTVVVAMKFENGALGVIDNSRRAPYGYDQRTEVLCEKGCVRAENDLNDTATISTVEGVEAAKPTWFFLERYNQAFIDETLAFTDAVLNDKDTPVTGEDGLQPVYMALAAEKSMREGRPVKLSEVKGETE